MERKKHNMVINGCIFAGVMALTFWNVFRNQDFAEIAVSIRRMSIPYIVAAIFLAMLFVAGEGSMIWYLLGKFEETERLSRCIAYSFIGFFFSGITPSATGGQPVQLYYMRKDRHSVSASSVVLMTVAVIYKFVLVLVGVGLLLFFRETLRKVLQGYYGLYFVGLFLNVVLVLLLFLVMFSPGIIRRLFLGAEKLLVRAGFWKAEASRSDQMMRFLDGYRETVHFLKRNKRIIALLIAGTFMQRFSVFLLTYVAYRGMGLSGTAFVDIVLLQASIYVAVDMLPVPGAQGITEAMYKTVFKSIFPGQHLVASMCIMRGISFYFLMLLGFLVWGAARMKPSGRCREW